MTTALVVGAGPTGLTAALTLARHGITVDLREQQPALGSRSLAATFHPPTLRILADLDVDLSDIGLIADSIEYRRGHEQVQFSLRELDEEPFPYRRHVPQLDVCRRILDVLLADPRVDVRFDSPAEPPQPGAQPGAQTGRDSSYDLVVAADGAGSRWRRWAGIDCPVTPYAGQVARLICDPEPFLDWPAVTYVFPEPTGSEPGSGAGSTDSVSVLRLADHARVILRVDDDHEVGTEGRGPLLAPPQWVARAEATLGLRPTVLGWSTYRAQRAVSAGNLHPDHRGAIRSDDRGAILMIVGDAAHLTNTRGGMNMNAGIHDAAVLARAFATAPETLPSVAAERLRVATEILLPRTHGSLGSSRFDDVVDLHADPNRRHRFLIEASMIDMVQW